MSCLRYEKYLIGRGVLSVVGLLLLGACDSTPHQIVHSQTPAKVASVLPSSDDAPVWYAHQDLRKPGFYIGYGEARHLGLAKSYARADLSKQLSTRISASSNQNIQVRKGQVSVLTERHVAEMSHARLSDLEVVKSQQLNGRYFVALGMDLTPLIERVHKTFAPIPKATAPSFFSTSRLWQSLSKTLGYQPGLSISAIQDQYFLTSHIDGQLKRLKLRQMDIPDIFPNYSSIIQTFTLNSNTQVLSPEENYFVTFQVKKKGYLTYLQIFENGEVVVIFANKQLKPNHTFTYPDATQYDGLTAELKSNQAQTKDLHITLLCHEKKDFSSLENVSTQAHQDYQGAGLARLNALSQHCDRLTHLIRIKR